MPVLEELIPPSIWIRQSGFSDFIFSFNLNDLFKVGKEVIEYTDTKDLVKKIKYYLDHEDERIKIARAGQTRTLKEHSYENRMREIITGSSESH